MTPPLDPEDIVRAWKDPGHRAGLVAPELLALPEHPAGPRLFAKLVTQAGGDARFLPEYGAGAPAEVSAAAVHRVKEWLRTGAVHAAWLDDKLAGLGLDRVSFAAILAGAGRPRSDGPPSWQQDLEVLLDGRYKNERLPDGALRRLGPSGDDEPVPFQGLVRWFVACGAALLRAGTGVETAGLTESAEADLLRGLALRLAGPLAPTLVLELNCARLRGELAGGTPRARYEDFAGARWQDPASLRELFADYPVLGRLLIERTHAWAAATLEMLGRLGADAPSVGAELSGARVEPLVRIRTDLSDLHDRGRSVAVLEDRAGRRVVYKPRSLGADRFWFQLVDWLNRRGVAHRHRCLAVVDRGDYGWMEHAEATDLPDAVAAERFHFRQGSLLALLHFARGTDFHYQNVDACGEWPVFFDLETLLSHRPPTRGNRMPDGAPRTAEPDGILDTGLLFPLVRGPDGRDIDVSGLGGGGDQRVVRSQVIDEYTDHMRIASRERTLRAGTHQPRIAGQPVAAHAYLEAVVAGFRQSYDLIVAGRAEVAGALRAAAEISVRFVPRNTQRYGLLLKEILHPDYLRDALDFETILDTLHIDAHFMPALQRLIAAEQVDLRRGDFPRFTARPVTPGPQASTRATNSEPTAATESSAASATVRMTPLSR